MIDTRPTWWPDSWPYTGDVVGYNIGESINGRAKVTVIDKDVDGAIGHSSEVNVRIHCYDVDNGVTFETTLRKPSELELRWEAKKNTPKPLGWNKRDPWVGERFDVTAMNFSFDTGVVKGIRYFANPDNILLNRLDYVIRVDGEDVDTVINGMWLRNSKVDKKHS